MVYNPNEIEKDYIEKIGGCWKCKTQLTLKDEEVQCDKCKTLIRWWCNSCKQPFDIVDKETNKKLLECKLCGYFNCPHCRTCLSNCDKWGWQKEILNILKRDIPIGQYPTLPERAREITELVINKKVSTDRKSCPERGVPISYAKNRIKSLMVKIDGFRVKDKEDRDAFLRRIEEITDMDIGVETTVTSTREKGSYGQEYRDAFNLMVCLGKFKIERINKKDREETYDVFVRCENGPCKFLEQDDLIITYCEKCQKHYPKEKEYCDICYWERGENKNDMVKLKNKITNRDSCQCYRGLFNKK